MKTSTKTAILENTSYGGTHRGSSIPGYEQFVLPVIEQILASSRHLSATSLARFANTVRSGVDYRGCSKIHSAAVIAQAHTPGDRERGFVGSASRADIDTLCRKLRFATNGWSRKYNQQSDPAPIESDRDYIVSRLAEIEAELAKPVEPPSSYHGINRIAKLKSQRYELTRCLEALGEGVGDYTLRLDSKAKFFAVLTALQQFIDNADDEQGESAELQAAESLRDELDGVLASL